MLSIIMMRYEHKKGAIAHQYSEKKKIKPEMFIPVFL